MQKDNTYKTKNSTIQHFNDFSNNIEVEKDELKKMRRSSFLTNDDQVHNLPNATKYKFNRVTRKMDDISKGIVSDKIKTIDDDGEKDSTHKFKIVKNESNHIKRFDEIVMIWPKERDYPHEFSDKENREYLIKKISEKGDYTKGELESMSDDEIDSIYWKNGKSSDKDELIENICRENAFDREDLQNMTLEELEDLYDNIESEEDYTSEDQEPTEEDYRKDLLSGYKSSKFF